MQLWSPLKLRLLTSALQVCYWILLTWPCCHRIWQDILGAICAFFYSKPRINHSSKKLWYSSVENQVIFQHHNPDAKCATVSRLIIVFKAFLVDKARKIYMKQKYLWVHNDTFHLNSRLQSLYLNFSVLHLHLLSSSLRILGMTELNVYVSIAFGYITRTTVSERQAILSLSI